METALSKTSQSSEAARHLKIENGNAFIDQRAWIENEQIPTEIDPAIDDFAIALRTFEKLNDRIDEIGLNNYDPEFIDIKPKTVENAKSILKLIKNIPLLIRHLDPYEIGPTPYGTILANFKNADCRNVEMEIGKDRINFIFVGKRGVENSEEMKISNLLKETDTYFFNKVFKFLAC